MDTANKTSFGRTCLNHVIGFVVQIYEEILDLLCYSSEASLQQLTCLIPLVIVSSTLAIAMCLLFRMMSKAYPPTPLHRKHHVRSISLSQKLHLNQKKIVSTYSASSRVRKRMTILPSTSNIKVLCTSCGTRMAEESCRFVMCLGCCISDPDTMCQHSTGDLSSLKIAFFRSKNPKEIDLSYLKLTRCPHRLGYIGTQLFHLNLSNNTLTSLPLEIGCLVGLEELYLQYNCLETLPDSIGNLINLTDLDLKNNCLCGVPSTLGRLCQLVFLNLTNNQLQSLPRQFGQLKNLQEVSLHSNKLKHLPEEMSNLSKLRVLYLGENPLQSLPAEIGNLSHIEELDIASCSLNKLPESLSKCRFIMKIWASDNRLIHLPSQLGNLRQLKELNIRNNQLCVLPISLHKLNLYTFNVYQNPLLNPKNVDALNSFTRHPQSNIPSLVELVARYITTKDIQWKHTDIPVHLKEILQREKYCSNCGAAFFLYYFSKVTFHSIGITPKVPLCQMLCSKLCVVQFERQTLMP